MAAETNLITSADLREARQLEFTTRFVDGLRKFYEALGVTRQIAKQAGTKLYTKKVTGILQDGNVAEGELIPLSKYKSENIPIDDLTIKKWRKAVSVEAITEKGYNIAEIETKDKMLSDVQKGIKSDFFSVLEQGTGTATGATFQAAIAQAWGQLQVLFEDTDIASVYFMNPLDVADYLATANITLQSVFGMTYVENFLGLGTVIFNSAVPKGTVYATAKENIVLYYIPVNGAEIGEAFTFTSDATGFIGVNEHPDYDNMTSTDTVISAVKFFIDRIDGVVKSTIAGA